MFLDRFWPIRGGAADIYMPFNTHSTNRIKKKKKSYTPYNEIFFSYREKGPRQQFV